ncbi:MAG: hypothetical protein AB1349_01700 [Elusimicrobiota bacterium]
MDVEYSRMKMAEEYFNLSAINQADIKTYVEGLTDIYPGKWTNIRDYIVTTKGCSKNLAFAIMTHELYVDKVNGIVTEAIMNDLISWLNTNENTEYLNNYWLHSLIGLLYLHFGNAEKGIAWYRHALKIYFDKVDTDKNATDSAWKEKIEEVVSTLEKAILDGNINRYVPLEDVIV